MQRFPVIKILDEHAAYQAAKTAGLIAAEMGFDMSSRLEIEVAISEICVNSFRYGKNGTAVFSIRNDGLIFEAVIEDTGKGIESISKATSIGYSSIATSLGMGLNAAKQNMDEFEIESIPGKGTKVSMRKFLPISNETVSYGVVSLGDERYEVNGDAYIIKEFDGDKVLLCVIDGLGQGEDARIISQTVQKIVEESYHLSLDRIIRKCDRALRVTNEITGAALGIALLTRDMVCWASVGDTFGQVLEQREGDVLNHILDGQRGVVGIFTLPKIKIKKLLLKGEYMIMLCTDGINEPLYTADFPLEKSAQSIANFIMNTHRSEYGDATVIVAKINGL
ncbi:MAG: ATP-binding protein [Bacteroidota bacterium]